jgi:hypothetical protein
VSSIADDPTRWKDERGDDRGLGARAAAVVEAARSVTPLTEQTLVRIRANVLSGRLPHEGRRVGRLPLGLRVVFATFLVVASFATASGAITLWARLATRVTPAPVPIVVPPAVLRGQTGRSNPPEETKRETADAPPVAPTVPEAPPIGVPRRRSVALATPTVPNLRTPAPEPTTPGPNEAPALGPETEAQLLARAITELRRNHNAPAALGLLDEYTGRFPHGVLEPEALRARLEAVIQMDDRETALKLLDARHGFSGRLGSELLLTRAELRANAGRHADALADFQRLVVLGGSATDDETSERSLYGHAVCLGHLGRDAEARADLVVYQQRFPGGKHAVEVTRLLQNNASRP